MNRTFSLPAEWEAQAGVVIAWPHEATDWSPRLERIESAYVALAGAIARFEPVVVCVANAAVRDRASRALAAAGVPAGRVRFVDVEYDDTWLRDSGPLTTSDGRDVGTATITGGGTENASPVAARILAGAQLNLWKLKLYLQLNGSATPAASVGFGIRGVL